MKYFKVVFLLIALGFLFSSQVFAQSDYMDWIQATGSAQWSARIHHTSVVFNNNMWVLGGDDGTRRNDVWYSSDGVSWSRATNSAGWMAREQHTSVVFDSMMWVIGGYGLTGGRRHDVWYSSDGVTWTQATAAASWTNRSYHTSVVFDNKMWVLGGITTSAGLKNDVWYSSDGITWTEAVTNASWSPRQQHTSLVYDNKMWVLGGDDGNRRNDVWYSTDGITWTEATDSAGWVPRSLFSAVVYNDKMWVIGGYSNAGRKHDVWYSSDGVHWTEATASAVWSLRYDQTSVAFDNRMWILGGYDTERLNDVWYSYGRILTLLKPNGGDTLYGGNLLTVKWRTNQTGFTNYRLLFSVDSGMNYLDTIAVLPPTDTTYRWRVPFVTSNTCRVMVQILDGSTVRIADQSDHDFVIQTVSIIVPNGGEYWQGGSDKIIKWRKYTGVTFSNYRLLLSLDGGLTYPQTIASNIASTESTYTWSLPVINSDMAKVKLLVIVAPDTIKAYDATDQLFTIDSDAPDSFSLLIPADNGWIGRNPYFEWQPSIDNFILSHYVLSIAVPSETITLGTSNNNYLSTSSGAWSLANVAAEWSGRTYHSSVVFNNKIWVMGGVDGYGAKNDVWYSSDGINWTQATDNAGWSPRFGQASVVFNNMMWVIGGYDYSSSFNDVWYSTDGVSWNQVTGSTGWAPRFGHTAIVFDNKMWILGGTNYTQHFNDVWYTFDGAHWGQATANAGWSGRDGLTSLVYDNKMWILGGSGTNDVWYTNEGVDWMSTTNSANWSPRQYHTSVVFDNKMWVMGGGTNDVWYSTNSTDWICATSAAGWSARSGNTSLVYDNKMWVIGGDLLNDVWYSIPPLRLPEGTHQWWVTAYDRANNSRRSNQSLSVRVDTGLPSIPTIISLSDSVYLHHTLVSFVWNKASDNLSGLKDYRLQISNNPAFSSGIDTIIADTSITFALNETTYWWRVCAIDSADNQGDFSTRDSFGIDNTAPSIPVLVSPNNNTLIHQSNMTFFWRSSSDNLSGIAVYVFQYALDSMFSNPYEATISDTILQLVMSDTIYFWRVKAVDVAGNTSGWSVTRKFEIDTQVPNVPILISPLHDVWLTDSSVIFNWSQVTLDNSKINRTKDSKIKTDAVLSSVRYIIQVDTSRDFTYPIIDTTGLLFDTLLLNQAQYFWKVQAYDLAGNQGSFSNPDSFGIDNTAPDIPNLISPTNGAITNNANVVFIWNRSTDNVSGVYRYILEYARNAGFTNPTDTLISDTTITLSLADTTYYWRVKAQDRAYNQSGWSSTCNFELDTRIPNAPALISPLNSVWFTSTSVIFNWSQVTSNTKSFVSYILQADTSRNFTNPIIDTTGFLFDTLVLNQARFFWRVQAYDAAGNQGVFSGRDSFGVDYTAPAIPNLVSPANSAILTDSFVTFIWNRSSDNLSGVINYQIQIANNSSFVNPIDTTISDTSAIRKLRDTTYYWRVRVTDIAGNQSAWSSVVSFRVITTGIEEASGVSTPRIFSIAQNSPNPFSRLTNIQYSVPTRSKINITIYDSEGQAVISLINQNQNPGMYSVRWNGNNSKGELCPNGVYFYKLETERYKATRKMLMLK